MKTQFPILQYFQPSGFLDRGVHRWQYTCGTDQVFYPQCLVVFIYVPLCIISQCRTSPKQLGVKLEVIHFFNAEF